MISLCTVRTETLDSFLMDEITGFNNWYNNFNNGFEWTVFGHSSSKKKKVFHACFEHMQNFSEQKRRNMNQLNQKKTQYSRSLRCERAW